MRTLKFNAKWFLALSIPPVLILLTLFLLSFFVSHVFTPNFFALAIAFGIPAGIFEEIGWMGFVFPKLNLKYHAFSAAAITGLFWGLWHLPVIDFLGAASPHGNFFTPYFLSFIAVMTAMRVLIVWLYSNTKSISLCQLMHISSTGFLAMFSPSNVKASQETSWYLCYAIGLWIVVGIVVIRYGNQLVHTIAKIK